MAFPTLRPEIASRVVLYQTDLRLESDAHADQRNGRRTVRTMSAKLAMKNTDFLRSSAYLLALSLATIIFLMTWQRAALLALHGDVTARFTTKQSSVTEVPVRSLLPRRHVAGRTQQAYQSACDKILADPTPLIRCQRDGASSWAQVACDNGTVSFQSPYGQDYYLYTQHFRHLRARHGVYLDVAANQPIYMSNSFLFDACLGWQGVCVEAHPLYVHRLRNARTCGVVPTCVGDVEGQAANLMLSRGAGGMEYTKRNIAVLNDTNHIPLNCTTLKTQLRDGGVTHVDYFNLDVDGHEMAVMRGIDWDSIVFNTITVEVSKTTLREIEDFLTERDYVRHIPTLNRETRETGLLHTAAVFLYKDTVFGQPV